MLRDRYGTTRAVTPMEGLMSGRLDHCKVAIVAVDGFEKVELGEPWRVRAAEGARVDCLSARGA